MYKTFLYKWHTPQSIWEAFNKLTEQEKAFATKLTIAHCALTELPDLSGFINLRELHCDDNKLSLLPTKWPPKLEVLDCSYNQLTTLDIAALPASLKVLNCNFNLLTSLNGVLPLNLVVFRCTGNELAALPEILPQSLVIIDCRYNCLTHLPERLPNDITELSCSNNQLRFLPNLRPYKKLTILGLAYNNLLELPPFPKSVQFCAVHHNPIPHRMYGIVDIEEDKTCSAHDGSIQELYLRILLYHQRKHWVVSQKYRSRFRRWLWEQVRLPKIEAAFHWSKLPELLDGNEDVDLDFIVDNWIKVHE